MSGRRARKEGLRDQRLAHEQAGATLATVLIAVGLVIALVANTSGGGSSPASAPPLTKAQLAALPTHLADNAAQANQVIDGSIEARLAALRGVPVVVNQWALVVPELPRRVPHPPAAQQAVPGHLPEHL